MTLTLKERNAEIIKLHLCGVSRPQICSQLKVTTNVVAGVLFRAHLTDTTHIASHGRGLDYADHERLAAVKLAREIGVKQASVKLKIPETTLGGWTRRANEDRRKARGAA